MSDAPPVLSVSDLTELLKAVVESEFPRVWVAGEISNCLKASSGHVYFTLKDEGAQLKAVMWRSAAQRVKFDWGDGFQVIARGAIEVYAARGQHQLVVDQIQPQGMGALELALRQLQEKLAAEGLFDPARKRPLPRFPRRIALVTSPKGAAVRDLIQVMIRRWPNAQILVVPVAVQGVEAAPQIAAAFQRLPEIPDLDVVITGRGGGSLEDLWAFNEEIVARAIANCPIPVVSAVGHETDVTIADLVSDRRALTPSEAAELVVPAVAEYQAELQNLRLRLNRGLQRQAATARTRLDHLAQRRCFTKPYDRIRQLSQRLDELSARLPVVMRRRMASARQQLERLAGSVEALSPLSVLSRGYSLTKKQAGGELIRDARQVQVGELLSTLCAEGEILSRCERIES